MYITQEIRKISGTFEMLNCAREAQGSVRIFADLRLHVYHTIVS